MPYRMRFGPFHAALFGLGFLTGLAPLLPAAADIAVSRRDCDRLVKYQQPPGVEYQPGVDAHGETVVPADLGGGVDLKLPETIIIPIEVLIQDRYHIPPNSALWSSKAELGVVTVEGDEVLYNGQPLTDPETAALAELCRKQLRHK